MQPPQGTDEDRYRIFAAQIETRPPGLSPLMFAATMANRPPEAAAWLLRWLEEQR